MSPGPGQHLGAGLVGVLDQVGREVPGLERGGEPALPGGLPRERRPARRRRAGPPSPGPSAGRCCRGRRPPRPSPRARRSRRAVPTAPASARRPGRRPRRSAPRRTGPARGPTRWSCAPSPRARGSGAAARSGQAWPLTGRRGGRRTAGRAALPPRGRRPGRRSAARTWPRDRSTARRSRRCRPGRDPVEHEVLVGGHREQAALLGARLGLQAGQAALDEGADGPARAVVDDPVAGRGRGRGLAVELPDLVRRGRAAVAPRRRRA